MGSLLTIHTRFEPTNVGFVTRTRKSKALKESGDGQRFSPKDGDEKFDDIEVIGETVCRYNVDILRGFFTLP